MKVRIGCKWGRIIFSLILTNFQPLLECESDDLPLTVQTHLFEFIKHGISKYAADNLDCESDHTLFTSFYTFDWKQPVIIWVSLAEYVHVLQYTENETLKIVYQLATK